jgi:chemotaxis protein histidine kinase CheA
LEAVNQQKILGYFIEEAKEHLETLEKGILELSSAVADAERINEMFRAAHSVKGGAAMLGYGGIQQAAHRLEDAFKILREKPIPIDQRLESLFLAGYDVLQNLLEQLQKTDSFQEGEAEATSQRGEPIFRELQDYLQQLQQQEPQAVSSSLNEVEALPEFPDRVRECLRQMLQVFRGKATPESRRQLQMLCHQLSQLAPQEEGWQLLLKASHAAITNPKHTYQTLAPVVIQELKRGSDCLELGQGERIAPSPELQRLAAAKLPQILVTLEPAAFAKALRQVFNRQQLSQLIRFLEA